MNIIKICFFIFVIWGHFSCQSKLSALVRASDPRSIALEQKIIQWLAINPNATHRFGRKCNCGCIIQTHKYKALDGDQRFWFTDECENYWYNWTTSNEINPVEYLASVQNLLLELGITTFSHKEWEMIPNKENIKEIFVDGNQNDEVIQLSKRKSSGWAISIHVNGASFQLHSNTE